MRLPGLSLFFPYLNDGTAMDGLLRAVHAVAPEVSERFEVIVIDDGSLPSEAQTLDRLAETYPGVRIVHHERTLGYGAAIRRGLGESRMDWVFYTDGDGQYDPKDIRLLWRRWQEDTTVDIVNGYKLKRSDPWPRVVLGEAYRLLAHNLFSLPIKDVNCDFRLMRGRLARDLPLGCDGGGIGLEIIRCAQELGARFTEVGIPHYPRLSGRSAFFTWRGVLQLIGEVSSASP